VGIAGKAPGILNQGSRWRRVVSVTLRPHPPGNSPLHSLCKRAEWAPRLNCLLEKIKKATHTENRTVVIRSYGPYREVEILSECWPQLRCVWNARKYRERCIVSTGGTHSSQWDSGLSKGNWRNSKRNISQLTIHHRPDDNEILKCYHGPLLMPVHIFADSCKVMVLVTVT